MKKTILGLVLVVSSVLVAGCCGDMGCGGGCGGGCSSYTSTSVGCCGSSYW